MDEVQIRAIINVAVQTAALQTKQALDSSIADLTNRISFLETPSRAIELKPVVIDRQIRCEETLDLVKSLPEFKGDHLSYVSWRQAAFAAHKVFEGYEGSSKYYQAVALIRNKVVGSADAVLSSFNTILNFQAIISRLDFTYADKRPIYLIEQEMSTLKQGKLSIFEFYEAVERKLTLLINKTLMTNEGNAELIHSLNVKYRQDALRTFISGLRKPMCDILFSARPTDMPTALALAQELEANQTRYNFANSFANYNERPIRLPTQSNKKYDLQNSTHFRPPQSQVQDMEVDPSTSYYRSPTQNPTYANEKPSTSNSNNNNRLPNKRAGPSDKYSRNRPFIKNNESTQRPQPKIQRVNNLVQSQQKQNNQGQYENDYDNDSYLDDDSFSRKSEGNEYDELEIEDEINFLGNGPSYHTLGEH